ncbi:sigma-70 family RNA polymerase sigma factor [Rhodanobacter denitrificans]|uniref:RNA polymerase sigma factor n=1 Tax=Rhodanobacter denitrificans TaxID=666685 RepID=UPI001F2F59AD|nr:sigma-70 family RNA polymerase sigma factor [Rhodanobacter denitrificans]UJM91722.1 sigma-70 family RNA polymerase sigma factor [Rhodanobacter denitrificans]
MSQALTATGFMGLDSGLSLRTSPAPTVPADVATANDGESPSQRRAAWMVAAQAGDRRAYARLLADSVALIRATARRQGVAQDQLDDVVQEALITVHRVRHTYDPTRSYDAWLTAIASRRAIDALRRCGRRDSRELRDDVALDQHPDADDASAATEGEQRAQRLHEAIAELPPGQREAVEQLGLRERSLSEAAELTGRNTGALKVNLHRALKALRERFHGEP